jgi:hypothetical protein
MAIWFMRLILAFESSHCRELAIALIEGFCSVNRPIVTSPKRGAKRLKRQVDWLVNGSLTGPIFSRALNQLTQLEIFPARDKDWPVNERNRDSSSPTDSG